MGVCVRRVDVIFLRMELYRYVTGVLHRFKVEPPPGDTLVGDKTMFFLQN